MFISIVFVFVGLIFFFILLVQMKILIVCPYACFFLCFSFPCFVRIFHFRSRFDSPPVMTTISASGNRISSSAEKCLRKLGVCMVVGVGGATTESTDGNGAVAVITGAVLVVVCAGRRGSLITFSFSVGQWVFQRLVEKQT